jgi:hypothetical protein
MVNIPPIYLWWFGGLFIVVLPSDELWWTMYRNDISHYHMWTLFAWLQLTVSIYIYIYPNRGEWGEGCAQSAKCKSMYLSMLICHHKGRRMSAAECCPSKCRATAVSQVSCRASLGRVVEAFFNLTEESLLPHRQKKHGSQINRQLQHPALVVRMLISANVPQKILDTCNYSCPQRGGLHSRRALNFFPNEDFSWWHLQITRWAESKSLCGWHGDETRCYWIGFVGVLGMSTHGG